jgi:hypothetical protein
MNTSVKGNMVTSYKVNTTIDKKVMQNIKMERQFLKIYFVVVFPFVRKVNKATLLCGGLEFHPAVCEVCCVSKNERYRDVLSDVDIIKLHG